MRHGVVRRWSAFVLPFILLLPVCLRGQEVTAQAPSSAIAGVNVMRHPREEHLTRGKPFQGDVRTLPQVLPTRFERPEFEEPAVTPVPYPVAAGVGAVAQGGIATPAAAADLNAPAPSPSSSFEGLDFANWGAGHPPDTNGDVGPQHYIQTINTSVGIYRKNGVRLAAFTFNSLMSQGSFGNLCDTDNFGDPVVLYDTFEDRWIITDFAFKLDGSGNIIAPSYQCLAVSKSGDPVAGGWNFYSISSTSGFGDYPKFGIWPDGLYMSANMFGFGAGGSYQNVRVWAFNKAQMYAGEPTVQILSFDAPSAEFTLLPSNARLQTGTPSAGSPNYFAVVWQFLNAISVYKFQVNWASTSTSTFSGPFTSLTSTWWAQYLNSNATSVPSPANRLDSLYPRLMVQNQYTNLGGVESLWTSHTVGAGNPTSNVTSAQAAVRYYQVKVTGGNVEANATQSFTYSPDTTVFRFMPSVDVDRAGNMAIGYSATDATLNPAIRYAGRLAGDPVNSIAQTEQSLIEGTGSQSGTCGPSSCVRWGDYSAMTLDVDGCTFWFTNLYYQTTGLSFNTRIGTFSLPGCTAVTTGTVQGTVTAAASGNPISGVAVELGSRTATSDVNGNYNFSGLSSGVYPGVTASSPGYNSRTAANIVVSDGAITTQNFSLTSAPTSGCFTDTTQADFQAGVPTNCDLTTSPGDVILINTPTADQQNTTLGSSGVGITITTWGGQTFTPAVTGRLTRADINLFCSGCTGTTPDLTLSVTATSGGLPTGADLAAATITGFSNGSAVFYTANFSSPATLTSGTQYALVIRPTANPSAGTYALTRSGTSTTGADVYPGGARVTGASSGTAWSIQTTGGVTTDAGFKTYMQAGFASSGTFVSSTKDANPAPGANVNWATLSWTADTPAATAIQFQVAASNNADGPFNFVGPDGTAGTFFTNGGSLAQFTGQRYLKYQASLSTTSSAVTPTLHDVSACFSDLGPTTLAVAAASGPVGGTADLSATLTSGATGVSGKSMSFKLNGNSVGSAMTDASGNATVAAVSLAGISAGSYPGAVTAAFVGDSVYGASSGSGTLTVQKVAQTITFGALANKILGDPDFTVSATASSGLTVTFAASGNCTVSGSTVHITGAGSCAITASQAGDGTYSPAANVQQSFSIAKAAQTTTFGALANKILGNPDFTVSATASSGLAVTFAASGNCTVTGSTVHISGAGSCTITASQAGDSNYSPAADVPRSFSILTSGVLSANGWRVLYVDSQETNCTNEAATNAIDGNPATMWHTQFCNSAPATPHEIQIDLGANYIISGFQYLPRQDQYSNGDIANYEFYVSADGVNWGTPVSTGTLITSASDKTQKQVTFIGVTGRYVRLRALTEVNGGPWTSAAEINVLGSAVATSGPQVASVSLNPASIAGGGTTSTATVTLTSAPLTNATVTLASSNSAATAPATVTVNAGTTSANFTVTSASTVSATALSVINASYNGSTGAALLTVTPGASSAAPIPRSGWRVLYVDSQETSCTNEAATNAIDGNPATMWHTQFCNSAPATPHEIQIDLGASYTISGFQYLPRQDQYFNGNIRNYEFYVSSDGVNWGTPVSTGTLIASTSDKAQKQVTFTGVTGRYVRLRALTEVNGGPWTSAAEINVLGSAVVTSGPQVASVSLSPASIAGGGTTSTATVTLTSAPSSNATVTLVSSNTAAATVPATVTVNAGTTSANFTVTSASTVSATALSVINATYNGSTAAAMLTVTPGTRATYTLSGNVSPVSLGSGTTLTLSGAGTGTQTADSLGNYTFGNLPNGTYTVTPSKSGFSFTPGSATVTITNASLTGVSFTASSVVSSTLISPIRAVVTFGTTQQFTSNTAVTWSVDGVTGGNSSVGTISTSGLYTPPPAVGQHTVTAVSQADASQTSSGTVWVSNSGPILTYKYDNYRNGQNASETVLTPANVNTSTFGKLFSYPVDGYNYAEPLYVPNLNIAGGTHNVVFVATEHDSVYAFDADGKQSTPLWHVSFINPSAGILPFSSPEAAYIGPEIGITSTPAIDLSTGTMYVVADTQTNGAGARFQLHALDIHTGAEKFGGPVTISGSFPGTGEASNGTTVTFDPVQHVQRAALLLANGAIYIAFASYADIDPYHGWILTYSASTLANLGTFCDTPDGGQGGIWMAGAGMSADSSGNVYVSTGNGTFSIQNGGSDYGDTVIKFSSSPSLTVTDWFSPHDNSYLDVNDLDLGSGGLLIFPDGTGGGNRMLIGGKNGALYLLNRDSLGHWQSGSDSQIIQSIQNASPGEIFGTPVWWNGWVYVGALNDYIKAYQLQNGKLTTSPISATSTYFPDPGAPAPFLSANGSSNGILWALEYAEGSSEVLHAWDATDLSRELYNSSSDLGDDLGDGVRFTVPTVADGKVFVGTAASLAVYGPANR
jgi:hypothetical protein